MSRDTFERAIRLIDEANSADPNRDVVDGISRPRELLYSERLTAWVKRLQPDASAELLLAARAQHICRWSIPRNSHPMDRAGYLRWRNALKEFHALKGGELLQRAGYDEATFGRVKALVSKKLFPTDPEARVLEDALCLVFLEFQLADFAARTAADKVVNALRKAWGKMTPQARAEALKLPYDAAQQKLIAEALSSPSDASSHQQPE